MYTCSTWHFPPKNSLRAPDNVFFDSLSLTSNTQISASYLLSLRNPQHFLVQRFEMTFIKKLCFVQQLYFNRLDITCAYENSIIPFYHNTGCTPGYLFYYRYWSHFHNISPTWGIFYLRYMWILSSSRRALSI